jgi:hypothetical protein
MNFEAFDNFSKQYLSFLDNEYVSVVLSLVLVLYASVYAPRLPARIVSILENPVVRGILIFLVVYMTKKSPSVALIVTLSVLVTVSLLSKYGEHMTDMPGCPCGPGCKEGRCRYGSNCPCLKMIHQYKNYEAFASEEKEQEQRLVKIEEAPKQELLAKINEEAVKQEVLAEIRQEAQPAKVEEAKVEAVLAKVEEKKEELKRELSAEELKAVCAEVKQEFKASNEIDVFDEESLSALREKVEHRHQNTAVGGFDSSIVYASL